MKNPNLYKRLSYEHEVLWARYEIREHYLTNVVQEIYQSTGQLLSLVRVQLCTLSAGKGWSLEKTAEPGNLVGKAIRDLRDMCRYFYPETELIENWGFAETIQHELERIGLAVNNEPVMINGTQSQLSPDTELVVFRMLQEILFFIKEQYIDSFAFKINYTKRFVTFNIEYKGNPLRLYRAVIEKKSTLGLTRSTLQGRAKLIEGKLQFKNDEDGLVRVTLTVPTMRSFRNATTEKTF